MSWWNRSSARLGRGSAARLLAAALLLGWLAGLPAPAGHAGEAAAPATPATPAASAPAKIKTSAEAIAAVRELAAKDEAELTYLGVAVATSRILDPELDAAKIEEQVAAIAEKAKAAAAKAQTVRGKVTAVNRAIYHDAGFGPETEVDVNIETGEGALDASMLHRVLERKQGVCLGLTTLYVVVAERAGLPIYPVHAPAHIFCRLEEGSERISIECTANGVQVSEEAIARRVGATAAARKGEVYFRRVTKKELLADQLNNLAYDLALRANGPEPLTLAQLVELMDLAVKLHPKSQEVLDSAGVVYAKAGQPVRALAVCDQAIELCKEYGGPPESLPLYQKRRAEYEQAVKEAREKPKAPTGETGGGAQPVPAAQP
jgi:regulator of sirC expression with transglutaminase-like and TPR domain